MSVTAQTVLDKLPEGPLDVQEQESHEAALSCAKRDTGVDLSSARIRAGFTRGHLLELVMNVPLDVPGDEEALQVASEIYLEQRLGEVCLDTWVANISVARIARTRGLMMVSDSQSEGEHHPLIEIVGILHNAVQGVVGQLPESLLRQDDAADWLALEIPPADLGLQDDRRFASTRAPEALKSVLEGLPFSSRRFTRGAELFVWLAWSAQGEEPAQRMVTRRRVEELLASRQQDLTLVGTGFGSRRDFVDLVIRREAAVADDLLSLVAELPEVELGFYDLPDAEHRLAAPTRLAAPAQR